MKIGSIGNTPIHIETSFIILVVLFVILDLERGVPLHFALLWAPLLFVSVLVHELGHAGTIAMFGFGASHIALAGFGGVTINHRNARPWQDVIISVAGPISSFLLAGLSLLVLAGFDRATTDPFLAAFLPLLIQANVFWGIFNLIPIHPLDGGHALRNVSRYFVSDRSAALFTAWVSILLAAAIGILGLVFRQIFVAIIAAMLIMQNYQLLQAIRRSPPPSPDDSSSDMDQKE